MDKKTVVRLTVAEVDADTVSLESVDPNSDILGLFGVGIWLPVNNELNFCCKASLSVQKKIASPNNPQPTINR